MSTSEGEAGRSSSEEKPRTYLDINLLKRDSERPSEPKGHGTVYALGYPKDSFPHFSLQGICRWCKPIDVPVISKFDALAQCKSR